MSEPTFDPELLTLLDNTKPHEQRLRDLELYTRDLSGRVKVFERFNEELRAKAFAAEEANRKARQDLDVVLMRLAGAMSHDELANWELNEALERLTRDIVSGGDVKFARKALGLTRTELANELGLTERGVRSLEDGSMITAREKREIVRLVSARLDELRAYRATQPTLRGDERGAA